MLGQLRRARPDWAVRPFACWGGTEEDGDPVSPVADPGFWSGGLVEF